MIGIDLVKISRIDEIIKNKGLDFAQKMVGSDADNAESLAGHYAAKEAFAKAMGTGLSTDILKNSKVIYGEKGQPFLSYKNKRYIISISHDGDYAVSNVDASSFIADQKYLDLLNKRPEDSNKGTFGRLGLIAGYNNMPGSALLATDAAFRSGVGYVYLYSSEQMLPILQTKSTEAIINSFGCFFLRENFDAIAFGPGLGFEMPDVDKLFDFIEKNKIPSVIDADGFYYLKKYGLDTDIVITPHPKEAAYLLDCDIYYVLNNREEAALKLAQKYKAVCLLKGKGTLIADEKNNIIINTSGSNALATAGCGDVLTGLIGGFLAQGMGVWNSAVAGAYFHGLAADIFSAKYSKRSMKSSDLSTMLKYVFRGEDNA